MSDSRGSPGRALGPGSMLGRFQILAPVAAGGMGRVWVARQHGQRGFQKLVALKTALESFAEDPEFEKHFLDEARVAARIQHPNVCTVLDLGEQDGALYLAMEWVAGGALSQLLSCSPNRRLPPRIAARMFAQACAGLHAAHELTGDDGAPLHVVHRDVSPQNLLVTPEGHVKVADFGVVKAADQLHQATATGEIKGKISYMAPEQFTSKTFDRRVDVFALGCTLYQATVGRKPFDDPGAASSMTIYRIIEGTYPRPSELVPGFPADLEAVIVRALARQPEDRFPTMEAMRSDLESYLATSGPPCTEVDVMKYVEQVVGHAMADRSAKIRQAIAALGDGDADRSSSEAVVIPSMTATPPFRAAEGGVPASGAALDGGGSPPSGPPTVAKDPSARPRLSAAVYVTVVILALVGGGLAALRESRGRAASVAGVEPPPREAPAPSMAVTSVASAPPGSTAPGVDRAAPVPASSGATSPAPDGLPGRSGKPAATMAPRAGKPVALATPSAAPTAPDGPRPTTDLASQPMSAPTAGGKPKRPIDVSDPLRQ